MKFKDKYRGGSLRLPRWDYRSAGAYFITICTKGREHFFGECKNGKMKLSTPGMIVQGCWHQIPYLYEHISLGAFVVMPDHIHGILILDNSLINKIGAEGGKKDKNNSSSEVIDPRGESLDSSAVGSVDSFAVGSVESVESFESNDSTDSTDSYESNEDKDIDLSLDYSDFYRQISPKSGSVSRIILQFKTTCTKHIREACPEINFGWQSKFHDHIIRNEQSFRRISQYIWNNPKKWDEAGN